MATKDIAVKLLRDAGIEPNGKHPYDIRVHNEKLYSRVLTGGSLALGESYMDGWWDVPALDEFICKILKARLDKKVKNKLQIALLYLHHSVLNMQSKSRAFDIGKHHYDIGNDLYQAMLDKRMAYSCGYWRKAKTLDQAQEHKLDLICRKLELKKGMTLLDIGCGWGSLALFAAQKYGVKVTGITVSKEQIALGKKRCAGYPVELLFKDYRDMKGTFDRIVSVGMFEHVGQKNYRPFMEIVRKNLRDDGIFLLHTIGSEHSMRATDPWMNKYIFPHSMIPSFKHITHAAQHLFIMEDVHNFGADYDKTLMAWHKNITSHWDQLHYSKRFQRMWEYYLLSCAGSFRARRNQLWQIVFTPYGKHGGYHSIRE